MHRYFARFVIEAETPLAVGSDKLHYYQDAPIEKDFNGLPYIPGTALAGAFQDGLGVDFKHFFGNTDNSQPEGSNLIFSDALLYDGKRVIEILDNQVFDKSYFKEFKDLPIRPHARHDHKATALEGGLFDQEVVYKGTRFKFEISLESQTPQDKIWELMLNKVQSFNLFLGSGQYRGYGLCTIQEIKTYYAKDFETYTAIEPSLGNDTGFKIENNIKKSVEWKQLKLDTSQSLFHFGAGSSDDETDAINYKERAIKWVLKKDENRNYYFPDFEEYFVIPGSSIKGLIAHRVAFYYNLGKKETISLEKIAARCKKEGSETVDLEKFREEVDKITGENNPAVKALFGQAKESATQTGNKGRVIIPDIFIPTQNASEVKLMHNTIDRFTGGTLDTALFSEKAFYIDELTINYFVEPTVEEKYFVKALADIKNGTLPIGGMAAKGHGIINGKS
ncbi:MAG: RAMP superfamily CRISPR-associated protein [Bacteroidetes bacterium]|nr:RAMP superfamily CRISPR-associated protein [Bacteroidota bacterium]